MVSASAIEIRKGAFGNDGRRVLSEVDLAFRAGSLYALTGINGAGKSTFIRTLAGLQPLISGEAVIEGRSLNNYSIGELARTVSAALTGRAGGFNLTARDAVMTGVMPYTGIFNRITPALRSRAESAMEMCGVKAFAAEPLAELSDGMYQKVALARAVAQATPVMLLDEPTAFLDFASRHEFFTMLASLAEAGRTVLMATHELELALRYCNDIVLFTAGSARMLAPSQARNDEGFRSLAGGHL